MEEPEGGPKMEKKRLFWVGSVLAVGLLDLLALSDWGAGTSPRDPGVGTEPSLNHSSSEESPPAARIDPSRPFRWLSRRGGSRAIRSSQALTVNRQETATTRRNPSRPSSESSRSARPTVPDTCFRGPAGGSGSSCGARHPGQLVLAPARAPLLAPHRRPGGQSGAGRTGAGLPGRSGQALRRGGEGRLRVATLAPVTPTVRTTPSMTRWTIPVLRTGEIPTAGIPAVTARRETLEIPTPPPGTRETMEAREIRVTVTREAAETQATAGAIPGAP